MKVCEVTNEDILHELGVIDQENRLIEQIKSTNFDVFQLVVGVSIELTQAGLLRYDGSSISDKESWIQLLKSSPGPISEQIMIQRVDEHCDR